MKSVSLLLLNHVNLAGFENARQGFFETNKYLESKGEKPIFDIKIVGLTREVMAGNGRYSIRTDHLIDEVGSSDIIVIPPIENDIALAMESNRGFYPWIYKSYQNGAHVVSLCLGAFILASTGLLNEKNCVTHWRASEAFKSLFPKVNLLSDKLLTDEERIYTGGGAFSSANLILYLIEKLAGRESSIYCSKIFQIDVGRTSQSPFIIFKGQKSHPDKVIIKAQEFIENNYTNRITVNDICENFGMGRRTLERRFKKATANTVVEYIQRTRMEVAKMKLESGHENINEIMFNVGYNDPKAFRDVFKKITGMTPVNYKNRFN